MSRGMRRLGFEIRKRQQIDITRNCFECKEEKCNPEYAQVCINNNKCFFKGGK